MNNFFQRLEPNTKGRDFVMGDIHAAYDLLDKAFIEVNFDVEVDCVISVGDLTDRGLWPLRCLDLLGKPWFHATRGNHEDMWLEIYKDGTFDEREYLGWKRNGLDWVENTDPAIMRLIIDEFRKLPIVTELETERGLVGFVHADIPHGMDWQTFTTKIQEGDEEVIHTALWGRDRVQRGDESGVEGIGRVYVGHTPTANRQMMRLGNLFYLDTAAVLHELKPESEGRLSFVRVDLQTILFDHGSSAKPVDARDLRPEPPNLPFGNYALFANQP